MKLLKLASYLDEAGDDPASSCSNLVKFKIPYVALRHTWSSNVGSLTDDACQTLRKTLKDHELSPILLAAEVGGAIPSASLMNQQSALNRAFDLAQYFKTPLLRVGVGTFDKYGENAIKEWMQLVQEKAISANIVPVLEVTHGCSLFNPIELVTALSKYRRWKILYDPAQFIIKQVLDPFIKYWTLIKPYVVGIDVHDYKIGHGHKPVGYGDTKMVATLNDAVSSLPDCWFFMEPALGRKYGQALTKVDVFKLGLDALEALEVYNDKR